MSSTSSVTAVWTAPVIERRENLPSASERETLEHFLDWHRETLLWKCGGLTGEQLASKPLASTELNLLGLLRHLVEVERWWFRNRFLGDESVGDFFATEEDPDADFHGGTAESAEADYAVFVEEAEQSRRAVAGHGLDETFPGRKHTLTLRWVYLHMIEEYARHLGHADLLREAIDGVTGE